MVLHMTQLDVAERILDILVKDLGLKSGDPIPDHRLKESYRTRGGDSADINVGLRYAEEREWLTYDRLSDTWYLTELGGQYP